MNINPDWEYVPDAVMGGVSRGTLRHEEVAGRCVARLTGHVSLDNNGGFIQMASDLAKGGVFDASHFSGIAFDVFGNGAGYDVRLRTDDLDRPWQSYRAEFVAAPEWETITLQFDDFAPHKTDRRFDASRLRRIGIVAVGREFDVDIAVCGLRFFR